MNGFRIAYKNPSGETSITWFGEPKGNSHILKQDIKKTVLMFFFRSYPDCSVLSLKPCTLAEFELETKK